MFVGGALSLGVLAACGCTEPAEAPRHGGSGDEPAEAGAASALPVARVPKGGWVATYVCRDGRCGIALPEDLCRVGPTSIRMGCSLWPGGYYRGAKPDVTEISREMLPRDKDVGYWEIPWRAEPVDGISALANDGCKLPRDRWQTTAVRSEPVDWGHLKDTGVHFHTGRAVRSMGIVCGLSQEPGIVVSTLIPAGPDAGRRRRAFDRDLGMALDPKTGVVRLPSRARHDYSAGVTIALPAGTPVSVTDEPSQTGFGLHVLGACGPVTLDLSGKWTDVAIHGWSTPVRVKAAQGAVSAWFWPGADVAQGVSVDTPSPWVVGVPVGAPLALGASGTRLSTSAPGLVPAPAGSGPNGILRVYEWAEVRVQDSETNKKTNLERWERRGVLTRSALDPTLGWISDDPLSWPEGTVPPVGTPLDAGCIDVTLPCGWGWEKDAVPVTDPEAYTFHNAANPRWLHSAP